MSASATSHWAQLPLRMRMSLITTALLIAALLTSSGAAVFLLHQNLMNGVDQRLQQSGQQLAGRQLAELQNLPSAGLPTDYIVTVWLPSGESFDLPGVSAQDRPRLPGFDAVRTAGNSTSVDQTFLTSNPRDGHGARYRYQVLPLTASTPNGSVVGYLMIGLSLKAVDATTAQMARTVSLVGIGVVLLTALIGSLAVERSLRSLRDIERTAQAVAAGDLSRRAPVHEPATTEVGSLGASFNAMVASLESAFAEREASEARMRRFVSDASHELRTPLASIRGYGELYRMGAVPPEEVAPTFARMEGEAVRMGALVNDLLALARLDEKNGLTLGPVDLVALSRDSLADLRALDPTRATELIAPEPVTIQGDAFKLRQVIMNLAGNTIQHTPPGTPVQIAVSADAEAARVEVRDRGPGIAAADSPRIFERFYRPDSSRARSSGGSGLGLAIVATIVAAHGGTVRHEDTPGGGATMVVRLPLTPQSPTEPEPEEDAPAEPRRRMRRRPRPDVQGGEDQEAATGSTAS